MPPPLPVPSEANNSTRDTLPRNRDDFPRRQSAARAKNRYLGIGLAHGIKGTGRGPFEFGNVRVSPTGRITAIGPHEELLHVSPTYQRLYQLQFMDPAEFPGNVIPREALNGESLEAAFSAEVEL